MPERIVSVDETNYYIHGLVHGSISIKLNPLFKDEVNKQLKGFNIICEDGFASWIPKSKSMNEIEYFNLNNFSFFDITRFWGSFVYSYLSQPKRKQEPNIISKVRKMTSIEDLNEIRNDLFKNYYPEPEGMNIIMKKANCGTINHPEGNIPLRIKRYIYEAKTALNYAYKNNLRELHIIVGCAHELPLEYLLQEKSLLDKYSL